MQLTAEDRFAIQDVLTKYCVLMDLQDETWVDIFADDATLVVRGDPVRHKADLEQFFRDAKRGLHLTSPPLIRPGDSPETANSTQTFLFRNAQTELFRVGYYEDELVRRDGTWRFLVRRVEFLDV
jgi:hypothetical protein